MRISSKLVATLLCVFATQAAVAQTTDAAGREQTTTSTFPKPSVVEDNAALRPHFGLLAGTVVPEGRYDAGSAYGLDVGFQPYIPFGLGFEYSRNLSDGRNNRDDLDQTSYLLKATYNFGGTNMFVRNSYAGIAVGAVTRSERTDLTSAPIIGFDIPLQSKPRDYLTLGASAKYLIISGNVPDVLTVNGAVKYWF